MFLFFCSMSRAIVRAAPLAAGRRSALQTEAENGAQVVDWEVERASVRTGTVPSPMLVLPLSEALSPPKVWVGICG